MGRVGAWRAGWSVWSRRRRAAVMATVAVGAALVGAGVEAASGPDVPPPIVWRDHVADPTTTTIGSSSHPSTDPETAAGSGEPLTTSSPDPVPPAATGPGSTAKSAPPTGAVRPPATTITTARPPIPGDLLSGLRLAAEGPRTGYQRELFGDWIDADHDRCDTREEVLQAQSTTPPQTDYSGTSCKVMAGDWVSLYDGAVLTARTEVEIDHVVALAEAWDSGASAWDAPRRRSFANDLGHPELLAVSSATNQAKSDRDPAQWSPPRLEAHCTFASDWVAVKVAWGLSADPAEATALRRMLATCPGGRSNPTPTAGSTPTTNLPPSPTTVAPRPSPSTTLPPADSGLVGISGLDCRGEAVTVRNGGSVPADLTGWSIHDAGDKHVFAFPAGYHLSGGASITVRSGGPAGAGDLQWTAAPVWNNDGDTATLVDADGGARSTRGC